MELRRLLLRTRLVVRDEMGRRFASSVRTSSLSETERRLLELKKELELLRFVDHRLPSRVTDRNWEQLLKIRTAEDRIAHFRYLYMVEEGAKKDAELKV